MDTTNNKGAPWNGTPSKTPRRYSKRFPAYGKQIMEMRLAGKVPPNGGVYVVYDWNLAQAFSRVVIPDDTQIENLELRYLAGLDVAIAYRDKDAGRVLELAQAILKVNPRILNTFAMDIPKNTILKNLAGEVLL
jgi:hypothetical protein